MVDCASLVATLSVLRLHSTQHSCKGPSHSWASHAAHHLSAISGHQALV
jgi:hypothetical protein